MKDTVYGSMMVFAGNATPKLAKEIAGHLDLPLGKANVGRFIDGEVMVEILENVRGRDVFMVQSTAPPDNDSLMELLVLADAMRRSSAGRVTAVIPYFGYARQDRRPRSLRVAITAKLAANLIARAGVDRVLTVDIHADQIQGFFDIPFDNVHASPILLSDLWKCDYPNLIVVSPDVGGVARARALAKRLDDADLAIIDKRRPPERIEGDEHHRRRCGAHLRDRGRHGGHGRHALPGRRGAQGGGRGPRRRLHYPSRALRRGGRRIEKSVLDELVVTDTIPLRREAASAQKIRQLSIADIMAETMRRISDEESVSSLYVD
jgi:ribose-phosphate pyrophosphokinase